MGQFSRCSWAFIGMAEAVALPAAHGVSDHFIILPGHPFTKGCGLPAIRHGDVLISAGDAQHASELSIKAGTVGIALARITQILILPVPVVKHAHLAWVGIIAGSTAGDQILFPITLEEGRCFPTEWRDLVGIVCRIFPGHSSVIRCQRSSNDLKMRPIKDEVRCFSFFIHGQGKIPSIHVQGFIDFSNKFIGAQETVRLHHGHELAGGAAHDFEPGNIFPRLFAIQDVGPVHLIRRMQRAVQVVRLRRDDQPLVLPVVEAFGSVAAHAPMPYRVEGAAFSLFLVFAVPVRY